MDIMAVTKTRDTRLILWRSPRHGTQVGHDGGHQDRGHKVDLIMGAKTGTQGDLDSGYQGKDTR